MPFLQFAYRNYTQWINSNVFCPTKFSVLYLFGRRKKMFSAWWKSFESLAQNSKKQRCLHFDQIWRCFHFNQICWYFRISTQNEARTQAQCLDRYTISWKQRLCLSYWRHVTLLNYGGEPIFQKVEGTPKQLGWRRSSWRRSSSVLKLK